MLFTLLCFFFVFLSVLTTKTKFNIKEVVAVKILIDNFDESGLKTH